MKIIIKRTDGGVSIMQLIDKADADTALEKWKVTSPGEYVSHREMPEDAIPEDRTFRNAWCDVSKELVIDHDMEKCREIWKDKLRVERAPLLASLDVEYQQADEKADAAAKADVAVQKQALRDVTDSKAIEDAVTPEDLKALTLEALTAD